MFNYKAQPNKKKATTMVLRLKVYLPNKQIRRFSYDADAQKLSYSNFVQWLRETVNLNQQETFALHYLDDENDWVILGSDMEWRECLGSISGNVLRIKFVSGDKSQPHHHHHHRRCGGCPWRMASNTKPEEMKVGPNDAVMDITETVRDVLPKSIGDALLGPKEEAIHYHIICDGCNTRNIRGNRYKCNECSNGHDSFDLCEGCHQKRDTLHDASHTFAKVDKPEMMPWMNQCWNKVQTHLFPQQAKKEEEKKEEVVVPKEPTVTAPPKIEIPKKQEVKPVEEAKVEEQSIPVFAKPVVAPVVAPVLPSAPVKEEVASKEETPFAMHLKILKDMGFNDEKKLVHLLQKWNGNIQRVVNSYFD